MAVHVLSHRKTGRRVTRICDLTGGSINMRLFLRQIHDALGHVLQRRSAGR